MTIETYGKNPVEASATQAADLAAFIRDVVEVTTNRQVTIESQTEQGFVVWLDDSDHLDGVSAPWTNEPGKSTLKVLEVAKPGQRPDQPSEESPAEEFLTLQQKNAAISDRAKAKQALENWNKHKDLYDSLFEARTPAEGMELVFALGFLESTSAKGLCRRHLVTAPAGVELERRSQTLTVIVEDAARQELSWLDPKTRTRLTDASGQLRDLQDAQNNDEAINASQAILSSFGSHGQVLSSPPGHRDGGEVGVGALPAVLLRKKDKSFLLQLLRDMATDIAEGGFVSEPFKMIVSPEHEPAEITTDLNRTALALPANEEQRLMIDNARKEAHMVVQGPPGTGKTHTIANLASVLMAEGRRVLITAENERALNEVHTKLPQKMRPLMLPMLKETGSGPLQASVNALTTRASATSTPESRESHQQELLARLQDLERQMADAQNRLIAIADQDRELRAIKGSNMPLSGHLIYLAQQQDQTSVVDRYLSENGLLSATTAGEYLNLHEVVTDFHRELAGDMFPEHLMDAAELGSWLHEHRSKLAGLPDPGEFDHSGLHRSLTQLEKVAGLLHGLPLTPWTEIHLSAEEYSKGEQDAQAMASDIDPNVTVVPSEAADRAIVLCEALLSLDEERFDQPLSSLIEQYRRASSQLEQSELVGNFERYDLATEVSRRSVAAIAALTEDRTGLLARHVDDHEIRGSSSIDALVEEAKGLIEGSRYEPGMDATISESSAALPDLRSQAELLASHLMNGGKMAGVIRAPKAVRDAAPLLASVHVGGSPIDTFEKAKRAQQFLAFEYRKQLIDNWGREHSLERPAGLSRHEWLGDIASLSSLSRDLRESLEFTRSLVAFSPGTNLRDPIVYFQAVLATVAREIVDSLQHLYDVHQESPVMTLSGVEIRSRQDAAQSLRAIKASQFRVALLGTLPSAWAESCDPLDVSNGDELAKRLTICAAAAAVPAAARSQALAPSAINNIVERTRTDHRRQQLLREHDEVIGGLRRSIARCVPRSPATQALDEALENESPTEYRVAKDALSHEIEMAEQANVLERAREATRSQHPLLCVAVEQGVEEIAEVLENIEKLQDLREYRKEAIAWSTEIGSVGAIHAELKELHRGIRRAEEELASSRCWGKAIDRIQGRRELRSSLSALSNAMDAVPKTRTAKSYPSRMRALRDATSKAAPAIPCWVMTIDRIAEVLGYPTGLERFDVVIIDEASQAWFPAMFLYAIADQVIVVGDKLQTSPSQVIATDKLASLARERIFGHRLENRVGDDLSLYDVAEIMTGPDMMIDHFRCVPEIIDISNRLSYKPMGRSLQASRVREPGSLDPVQRIRVNGSRRAAGANHAEVDAIVEQVIECHMDPAYEGMDFGVVVVGPTSSAHIKILRAGLLHAVGPEAMRDRDLEVGTASQFQGAERNVMFLSLLVAPDENGRIRKWSHEHSGRNRRNVQQLNVATSRAKDQLWIYHSFDMRHLAPGDARAVILEVPEAEPVELEDQLEACESQFERDVVEALIAASPTLKIRTQVEAIGYSIDIVIEDSVGSRLAVECDGDRWHTSDSQVRSDLYRQRTLENIGWRFYRFLASEWYGDSEYYVQGMLSEVDNKPSETNNPLAEQAFEIEDTLEIEGDLDDYEDDENKDELLEEYLVDFVEDDDLDDLREHKLASGEEGVDNTETGVAKKQVPATDFKKSVSEEGEDWSYYGRLSDTRRVSETARQFSEPAIAVPKKELGNASLLPGTMSMQERNRKLAAALRDMHKIPNGAVWQRAKRKLEDGATFEEAATSA